jgi:hypothetical protein
MRTTLTIDDDVAVALERIREGRSLSLRDAVNEALRRGLRAMDAETQPRHREPYLLPTWNSGGMRISVDHVSEALDWAEGDGHK